MNRQEILAAAQKVLELLDSVDTQGESREEAMRDILKIAGILIPWPLLSARERECEKCRAIDRALELPPRDCDGCEFNQK